MEDPFTQGLSFDHTEFAIETYVKQTLKLKLDPDVTLCRPFLSIQGCPLGSTCPLRHSTPSSLNFLPPAGVPSSAHGRTVCKHWLRGLCKKGWNCEFMHEYNLRKMSECWFFAKYGFCSNGDECMYLHVTEGMRIKECGSFRKGFCAKGPDCPLKHVRRVACPAYLVGFCSAGPSCEFGHAKFEPTADPPNSSTRIPDVSGARFLPEASFRLNRKDWLDFAADDRSQGASNNRGGGGGNNNNNNGGNTMNPEMLKKIVCFKCNQNGHFANTCNNAAVPGQRGGVERFSGQGGGGGGGGRNMPY